LLRVGRGCFARRDIVGREGLAIGKEKAPAWLGAKVKGKSLRQADYAWLCSHVSCLWPRTAGVRHG